MPMIPVVLSPNRRVVRSFVSCVYCGLRLSAHASATKKFCLECEERKQRALVRAHYAVRQAIAEGRLRPAKEFSCTDCAKPAVCYDHRDYSQPLLVEPVCKSCNNKRGPALQGVLP